MTEEQHVQAAEKMKKDLGHIMWFMENVNPRNLDNEHKEMFWESLKDHFSRMSDKAKKMKEEV